MPANGKEPMVPADELPQGWKSPVAFRNLFPTYCSKPGCALAAERLDVSIWGRALQ